jgi:hypothetical protein
VCFECVATLAAVAFSHRPATAALGPFAHFRRLAFSAAIDGPGGAYEFLPAAAASLNRHVKTRADSQQLTDRAFRAPAERAIGFDDDWQALVGQAQYFKRRVLSGPFDVLGISDHCERLAAVVNFKSCAHVTVN